MKLLQKITLPVIVILIFIQVLITNVFFIREPDFPSSDISMPFNDGWEYSWEGNEKGNIISLPTVVKGGVIDQTLLISNTLTLESINDATLFIRTSQQYLKVSVDGNLIYSFIKNKDNGYLALPGSSWHFVRLPQGYQGKKVEISIIAPNKTYLGYINGIYIGSRSAHLLSIFYKYSGSRVIASVIVLLGIILIILYCIMKSNKNKFDSVLFLGLFSILVGIWISSESKIIQLLINKPVLIMYTAGMSLFLIPIPLIRFILSTYKLKNSAILKGFDKFFTMFFILSTILQMFNNAIYMQIISVFHVFLFAFIISLIIILFKEMFLGNRSIRLLFIGCIIICAFALLDLWKFHFSNFPGLNTGIFLEFGMLAFILIMSSSLGHFIQDINAMQARNEIHEILAYTDILTGLKNRTSFEDMVGKLNTNLKPENLINIIIFDVNNLKYCNDTFGHKEGDQLICDASDMITEFFKAFGEIYRIGGDEFVAISIDHHEEVICNELSLFKKRVHDFCKLKNHDKFGIACGMASFKHGIDKDVYSVMVRADEAMYACKYEQKQVV